MVAVRNITPKVRFHADDDPVLVGRARVLYETMAPDLEASGRLLTENEPLFRLFCRTLAIAEDAGLEVEGVASEGRRDNRVADPTWRGYRDATDLAVRLAREFGLTPASRGTAKIAPPPDEEASRLLA